MKNSITYRSILLAACCCLLAQAALLGQWKGEVSSGIYPRKKREYQDTVWTIAGRKALDSKYRKWKTDINFDARTTLLSATTARLGGLRIGLEFRRVHRFGIGFYNVGNAVPVNRISEISPSIDRGDLALGYTSLYYERVLFFHRKWEWSSVVHLGVGNVTGSYYYENTNDGGSFDRKVSVAEFSSTLYFNLTYFMSVGAGMGYRGVRSDLSVAEDIFSAPVGIFRIKIRLFKMVGGLFNKDIRQRY